MTKEPKVVSAFEPVDVAPVVVKECPKCHAAMWQGPHLRGRVVDGKFEPAEELYSCVQCHAVMPISDMQDRVSLAATL